MGSVELHPTQLSHHNIMPVLENCCCCTVKTGSVVLAALMLIGSVISVGSDAKDIMAGPPAYRDASLISSEFGISHDQAHTFLQTAYYTTIANLFLSIICIVISSILIYGVNKENAAHVKPMLVFIPLDFVVRFVFVCIHSINMGFLHPVTMFLNVAICISMVIEIFVWLCIYSHYQQLKEGSDYSGNEMKPV